MVLQMDGSSRVAVLDLKVSDLVNPAVPFTEANRCVATTAKV
jgi:hypothetical protein